MSDAGEDTQTIDRPASEPLSLEFDLPDAPQKVWRALTEPGLVARWIVPGDDERRAGPDPDYDLLDAEPGRRVSYRWREGASLDGVVTFSISTNAVGGTRLTIVHSDMRSVPAAISGTTSSGVVMSGALACRLSFTARRTASAANLDLFRARAA